jgi:putrescine transport system substrate-binding protein
MKLIEANDPGNKFAVPYMYGTILIGFNPDKVKAALGANAPVDSWDLIFKEENISKLKQCGVALLDSPSEILPLALQHLGLDPNSSNPKDYEKAEALLMRIRPYITYFHSSKYMADIANGDICVAVGYSGSFSQAANRAKDARNGVIVDMRLPKEGAPIWFDMLAIPKGAKNPQDAYTFINYLLQPHVIAPISDFVGYPNPNKDATEQVDPAIRNNPNLYPTEAAMATLYTLKPLGRDAERARTRAWSRIKSGT